MGTPIKSIRKTRIYSVLGNRSLYTNNTLPLSTFFDTPLPPGPTSRPQNSHLLSTTRQQFEKPPDSPTHNSNSQPTAPPNALALSLPSTSQLNTLLVSAAVPPAPLFSYPLLSTQLPAAQSKDAKSRRPRYTLDLGAYGIPKRRGLPAVEPNGSDVGLSVQVGEDAYFMRENAMGVADGVGGWARKASVTTTGPTPSALFARRLMHFCASEISEAQTQTQIQLPNAAEFKNPASWPWATPVPSNSFYPFLTNQLLAQSVVEDEGSDIDLVHTIELQDSLDELEDGLDVLMILERAYERTLRAHVIPVPTTVPPTTPPTPSTSPRTIPLLSGSSTALLAILEHPSYPRAPHLPSSPNYHSRHGLVFQPRTTTAIDLTSSSSTKSHRLSLRTPLPPEPAPDAILKIAHVGDCVGILVRGDEIIWRSEEMWCAFNTPAQLGPLSAFPPARAHTATLPVCADDVLILASDGLSDNLWDADVLAEVVRLRSTFLGSGSADAGSIGNLLRRRTLAGMLSEALCARARRIAERPMAATPFARRAQEHGHAFRGGKCDDISVVVAVVSPVVDQV